MTPAESNYMKNIGERREKSRAFHATGTVSTEPTPFKMICIPTALFAKMGHSVPTVHSPSQGMKTRIPRPDLSCSREPTSFWIWVAFFLLTFLSVPFMFAGRTGPLISGIPLWFLISLVCYFLMAALVAYVIMRRWRLAGSILGERER